MTGREGGNKEGRKKKKVKGRDIFRECGTTTVSAGLPWPVDMGTE